MFGVAIYWRELPAELIDQHNLEKHKVTRDADADPEYVFRWHQRHPIPAVHNGELGIYPWGNHKKRRVPQTGWIRMEDLATGIWSSLNPEPVEIPAFAGYAKGVWYHVPEGGIRGVIADGAVFMLTQEASHYYQTMTRLDREPVFAGRQI